MWLFAFLGLAGGSTSGSDSYGALLLGAEVAGEARVADHVRAGGVVRIQRYWHPEDEDFGSRGWRGDLVASGRYDFAPGFVALRAGLGWLHRVPYNNAGSENHLGWVVGVTAGADLGSLRLELSVARPSFSLYDDTSGVPIEIVAGAGATFQ